MTQALVQAMNPRFRDVRGLGQMDEMQAETPLSFDLFKQFEGQAFGLAAGDAMLDLVLSDVAAQRAEPGPHAIRTPFSLFFEGTPGLLCPQGIYRLENAALGALELFLVPIARKPDDSYRYQAVFA